MYLGDMTQEGFRLLFTKFGGDCLSDLLDGIGFFLHIPRFPRNREMKGKRRSLTLQYLGGQYILCDP